MEIEMAIRIRDVDGRTVALCAAKTLPESGDIYLDDGAHHALTIKFEDDFESMGMIVPHPDKKIRNLMAELEVKDNG